MLFYVDIYFFGIFCCFSSKDCEMISYELRVASCKLWVAILRKLIYELRVTVLKE